VKADLSFELVEQGVSLSTVSIEEGCFDVGMRIDFGSVFSSLAVNAMSLSAACAAPENMQFAFDLVIMGSSKGGIEHDASVISCHADEIFFPYLGPVFFSVNGFFDGKKIVPFALPFVRALSKLEWSGDP